MNVSLLGSPSYMTKIIRINGAEVAPEIFNVANEATSINSKMNCMINNEFRNFAEVKKVAFVDGNRAINENNVKKHIKSLKAFGCNLVPMLYVDAVDVKGYRIYDAETDELIEPEAYGSYVVVLDGQHRYKAAMRLATEETEEFSLDNLRWEKVELNGHSFQDVLIEVNTRTQPWKGSDYISGCLLNAPDNEVALFAKSLTDLRISSKTANKYIFFNERFSWSAAMKDATILNKADLNRAKSIWEVVKTFPDKIKRRSVIIDYIIEAGGTNHWQEEIERIKAISDEDKKSLEKEKVKNLAIAFRRILGAV